MTDQLDTLLAEQAAYYRARAGEYDREYTNPELAFRTSLVRELPELGDVLELACGTGQWTLLLAGRAATLTAVDAAPEMLAIARQRVAGAGHTVEFVRADLFGWRPPRRYDTVFFAFWLSHVPPARFAEFWELVAVALAPGGRAVFVDDGPAAPGNEHVLDAQPAPAVRRWLADGSEHRVVKVISEPDELTAALTGLGWTATVRPVHGAFIAGTASLTVERQAS